MTVTRCASSHLMTCLLAWRNPQGREEYWLQRPQGVGNRWTFTGKVISTELGLGFLTITSAVETVAYSALTILSLVFYPLTDKPYEFCSKLLQSSSFTIIWGLADTVFNLLFVNLMTHESFARCWGDTINPTSIALFRFDDRVHLADWAQQHGPTGEIPDAMLQPIVQEGRAIQALIAEGANLIQQDVLENASPGTLEQFKEMDPSIYMFVLTKAIYIYTFGAKSKAEIPNYFKPSTKQLILAVRQEDPSPETVQELQRLMTDPTAFSKEPQGNSAQSLFNRLRNVASGELQNSLFATRCWNKAIEQLPAAGAITS